jgi:hypothetical protein
MKAIKLAILIFGIAGLSTIIVPYDGEVMIGAYAKAPVELLKFCAIFLVPTIMGAILLSKRPAPMWPAVLALAGFSFGFVQGHLWEVIPHIPDGALKNISMLIGVVAILGGMVASVIAVVKPDARA